MSLEEAFIASSLIIVCMCLSPNGVQNSNETFLAILHTVHATFGLVHGSCHVFVVDEVSDYHPTNTCRSLGEQGMVAC